VGAPRGPAAAACVGVDPGQPGAQRPAGAAAVRGPGHRLGGPGRARRPRRWRPQRPHRTPTCRPLDSGTPHPVDAVVVQQPARRQPVRSQFGGDLCQQHPRSHHPVGQVCAHVGEAKRGHAGGDPLLGVVPPLLGQPLGAGPSAVVSSGDSAALTCRSLTRALRRPGMLEPASRRASGTREGRQSQAHERGPPGADRGRHRPQPVRKGISR
jgi:hypothetical protein